MPVGIQRIEYRDIMVQKCPLCGMNQPILVQGLVSNPEKEEMRMPVLDKGYSFCNCYNIFFTDWENMDQRVYDNNYMKKYNNDNIRRLIKAYADEYFDVLQKFNCNIRRFAEIGCINPVLLDCAKDRGWETLGVDINPSAAHNGHDTIICNVEKDTIPPVDVIWASHIFEHFKDPKMTFQNIYYSLNPGGVIFIAMPDPYFIDWNYPHSWVHWHLREHHILWDMDSFIEFFESVGFECVFSKRNAHTNFICIGDYHLIFRKRGGKSFEPYSIGWNNTHREQIRYRDGYICQICGKPEVENVRKLAVHHIDYNKNNIAVHNLISLCTSCHSKTNHNRDEWQKRFKEVMPYAQAKNCTNC